MDVKQLNGKTIKTVENQENGYSVITFTDGTTAVILVAFITAAIAAAASPKKEEKKEEVKAPAKKEEVKKAAPAKKEAEEDEDDEDEEITWEDLKEMDEEELAELIDAEDLDVDADDYEDDEDGLRKAIAKEMEIEIPKKKKK